MIDDPGSTAAAGVSGWREATRLMRSSARLLTREIRARITTDLVSWPYRSQFAEVWPTVDQIPGWFHEGSAALLFGVIQELKPIAVVEIGSYLGRSTAFFALSLRQVGVSGIVTAVDPHTGDRQHLEALKATHIPSLELFRHHLRAAKIDDLVVASVKPSANAASAWTGPIDLLYVDGWHSYEAVIEDGNAWLPHLSDAGVVVFDDYVAYPEVRQAVRQLAEAGTFHLWGAVFGQAIGGVAAVPPPSIRRAFKLSGQLMANRLGQLGRRGKASHTGIPLPS